MRRVPESEKLYELVGSNVARHRAQAKLTQSALAARCDRTRGSIANIELGTQRPTLHTLWTLAEALGVELRSLLPTRAELGAGPGASGDAPKTPKRVEKVAGERREKVASFIAATRSEENRSDGIRDHREARQANSSQGGDRRPPR